LKSEFYFSALINDVNIFCYLDVRVFVLFAIMFVSKEKVSYILCTCEKYAMEEWS
jgi:hypothetical protein